MEIIADAEWISNVNDVYEYLRNINEQNMKPETRLSVYFKTIVTCNKKFAKVSNISIGLDSNDQNV